MAQKELEAPPKKKRSKLKLLIILIIFLLILGGAGFAVWKFVLGGSFGGSGDEAAGEQKVVQKEEPLPESGHIVTLPAFLVNLSDPLGRRYIKATFEIELPDEKAVERLNSQMPRVRDSIIMLLSSKAYADIATPESKILLKTEVADRLNLILRGPKVMQVYITDMVIQ